MYVTVVSTAAVIDPFGNLIFRQCLDAQELYKAAPVMGNWPLGEYISQRDIIKDAVGKVLLLPR